MDVVFLGFLSSPFLDGIRDQRHSLGKRKEDFGLFVDWFGTTTGYFDLHTTDWESVFIFVGDEAYA